MCVCINYAFLKRRQTVSIVNTIKDLYVLYHPETDLCSSTAVPAKEWHT